VLEVPVSKRLLRTAERKERNRKLCVSRNGTKLLISGRRSFVPAVAANSQIAAGAISLRISFLKALTCKERDAEVSHKATATVPLLHATH